MTRCPNVARFGGEELRCDLEEGHDGPHHTEGEIPPDLGQVIEEMISDMERAAADYRRAARSATIWRWVFIAATALQAAVAIWRAVA